jgi:dipeptidyl aminopeptidase/acylaminoacyl peptidase
LNLKAMMMATLVGFSAAWAAVPLIPRDTLLGNPERAAPKISPDGKWLAYLAPDKDNILQVWVRSIDRQDDRVLTQDKKRGIRVFFWSFDNQHLLYMQDVDGNEDWQLFGVNVQTRLVRAFTAFADIRTGVVGLSHKKPNEALISLNLRNRTLFDVYRLDLTTGALTPDTQNPGDVISWSVDSNLVVRGAHAQLPTGEKEIRIRASAQTPWRTLFKTSWEEEVRIIGFGEQGNTAYLSTTLGSNTERIVERDLERGTETLIAHNPRIDSQGILVHPTRRHIQAISYDAGKPMWDVKDKDIWTDFEVLKKLEDGVFGLISRDLADKLWLVATERSDGPIKYYLYNRETRTPAFLFSNRPKLEGARLSKMEFFNIPTRDGLNMLSYLSLPPESSGKNLPMVLLVHGGPWARDSWGYSPEVQLLTNRGYAVLQVNFRGSSGFGKEFLNAGAKQWGRKMHEDLLDAVNWAVGRKTADPKRVCIMGGSYGGYAALAGAAFSSNVFACAVDIVGPSNLITLVQSIPPYWKPLRATFDKRMGNIDDPKDRELLQKASPLFFADKIRIPLLIAQGKNDPRVKEAESQQIVDAMRKNGLPVTYVLYSDEGHGFARPENRTDFYARAEAFLAQTLKGRVEPLKGERIPGSSANVTVFPAKPPAKAPAKAPK